MPSVQDTLSRMTARKPKHSLKERAMRRLLELREQLNRNEIYDSSDILSSVSASLHELTTISPPSKVSKDLQNLKKDLDNKIPPKEIDRNVIIASWNIKYLGAILEKWQSGRKSSPKRDLHSLHCIAEIISHFDVVAIQEAMEYTKALKYIHEILGPDWGLMLSRESPPPGGNRERFAFIFDMRRVQPSGLASHVILSEKEKQESGLRRQLSRIPYAVGFRSGAKSFTLVSAHIIFMTRMETGDLNRDAGKAPERILELEALAKYLETWAMKTNVWDQNIIALGDFNVKYAGNAEFEALTSRGLFVHDQILKAPKTIFYRGLQMVRQFALVCWYQNHPHIPDLNLIFKQGGSYAFDDVAMASRSLSKRMMQYHISDHYPIWAEFLTDDSRR